MPTSGLVEIAGGGLQAADFWLVDSLVVPASLHDVEGRFVRVNAAAERASGYSNSWWLGRHFTESIPSDARERVAAQFRRAVDSAAPTELETVFVDSSGELRGVHAQYLPLRAGGAVVGVLILAFEVQRPASEPIRRVREPHLTRRQREILELVASGRSTSEIAKSLTLSTETVRNHVRGVLRELDVHTRLEAIASARRLGLLAPQVLQPPQPHR
jgi:PAS domain S-box-containing protein